MSNSTRSSHRSEMKKSSSLRRQNEEQWPSSSRIRPWTRYLHESLVALHQYGVPGRLHASILGPWTEFGAKELEKSSMDSISAHKAIISASIPSPWTIRAGERAPISRPWTIRVNGRTPKPRPWTIRTQRVTSMPNLWTTERANLHEGQERDAL